MQLCTAKTMPAAVFGIGRGRRDCQPLSHGDHVVVRGEDNLVCRDADAVPFRLAAEMEVLDAGEIKCAVCVRRARHRNLCTVRRLNVAVAACRRDRHGVGKQHCAAVCAEQGVSLRQRCDRRIRRTGVGVVAVSGNIDIHRACRTKQRDYREKDAECKFEFPLHFSVSCY